MFFGDLNWGLLNSHDDDDAGVMMKLAITKVTSHYHAGCSQSEVHSGWAFRLGRFLTYSNWGIGDWGILKSWFGQVTFPQMPVLRRLFHVL